MRRQHILGGATVFAALAVLSLVAIAWPSSRKHSRLWKWSALDERRTLAGYTASRGYGRGVKAASK